VAQCQGSVASVARLQPLPPQARRLHTKITVAQSMNSFKPGAKWANGASAADQDPGIQVGSRQQACNNSQQTKPHGYAMHSVGDRGLLAHRKHAYRVGGARTFRLCSLSTTPRSLGHSDIRWLFPRAGKLAGKRHNRLHSKREAKRRCVCWAQTNTSFSAMLSRSRGSMDFLDSDCLDRARTLTFRSLVSLTERGENKAR
jgi:hypothetical protein